jgi:hypothetical protein
MQQLQLFIRVKVARMPENANLLYRTGKAALSVSLASLIRMSLGGVKEGLQSLDDTYRAVSPFSPIKHGTCSKMLDRVPEVLLETLGGVPEQVTLDLRFVDTDGATPLRDLLAILVLAKKQNPQAVLEFGTYFGSTTANLALNLPEARIHTIDLPEDDSEASALVEGKPVDDLHLIQGRKLGRSFRGTQLEEKIVQHQGDTATYDYSVIRDAVTLFLVDGSHTYEYARSDTMRCFAMAKGESTFMWHDCDKYHPGVLQWLVEMIAVGLPVVRVQSTSLACMKIDAGDRRIQKMLSA